MTHAQTVDTRPFFLRKGLGTRLVSLVLAVNNGIWKQTPRNFINIAIKTLYVCMYVCVYVCILNVIPDK